MRILYQQEQHQPLNGSMADLLGERALIIASNRGPFTLHQEDNGEIQYQRGGGGLVTALLGLVQHIAPTWISSAISDADRSWKDGWMPLGNHGSQVWVEYITPEAEDYNGYYNVISNPLIWFLQHAMWDVVHGPMIDRATWDAWENGYVAVNRLFAEAIARRIQSYEQPAVVMFQDYHLYLAPRMLRDRVPSRKAFTLTHFIHIPWPGPEDWGILPPIMRQAILRSLCANDILGVQTREDGLNFIRTCESYLPGAHVNFKEGRVWFRRHNTFVRDFPISIDVDSIRQLAGSKEVASFRKQFANLAGDNQLIVRIDRTEPSKNLVRGFLAYEEMLEQHPEHIEKVKFLVLLVPSRLEVPEYQVYLDELMAAAGRVNARFGNGEWEPVRILVGENYPRAVAALQLYDVLLVNAIADGMNLVAKEGPIVNQRNGVVILSERAGAVQQLGSASLVISPCDVYATAEALHRSLTMGEDERKDRASRLRRLVEEADIVDWFRWQLEEMAELHL